MSEGFSWVLPAAAEAYANREQIAKLWHRLAALLLGRKKSIALTGLAGVGKTVLLDHLTGTAFKAGYTPPGQSKAKETGKVHRQGKRLSLSAVPGQESAPRLEATDDLFGENAVDGVIHVVANGFTDIRNEVAKEALIKQGNLVTLADFRKAQLENELTDLDKTCELIRKSIRTTKRPQWMLVVADKVDLYYDAIGAAETYYSPHGQSEFTKRLQALQGQVGSDSFEWEALPACAWLENFTWNKEEAVSRLKPKERDFYIGQLLRQVEAYCAR